MKMKFLFKYIITTGSNIQVARIKEVIAKDRMS